MTTRKKTDKQPSIGEQVNPLFVECLKELVKKNRGKKSCETYKLALKSLQAYPLKLRSGKEAQALKGIGEKIGKKIDDYLRAHGVEIEEESQQQGFFL